jgi:hypothetical protein
LTGGRMTVHIESGKGKKDRCVTLPSSILDGLLQLNFCPHRPFFFFAWKLTRYIKGYQHVSLFFAVLLKWFLISARTLR